VTSVVYYLRRNGLIKIGWSGALSRRMRDLQPDELLAVEPGCLHIETGRHHQFADHRLPNTGDGDEWFSPEPEVLAHIARMATLYPTPDLRDLVPAKPRRRRARRPPGEPLTEEEQRLLDEILHAEQVARDAEERLRELHATRGAECKERSGRAIVALHRQGESWPEISRLTGLSRTTLLRRAQPYL
jgi:hypothetical protein